PPHHQPLLPWDGRVNTSRISLQTLIVVPMIALPGCTPNVAPTVSPPSPSTTVAPTTTPSPQPSGPRYEALPTRFCETLDWEEIGEQLNITVIETSFADWSDDDQSPSGGGPSWWAHCELEGRTDDGAFQPSISIGIDVFEADREAGQSYENWVATYRDDFGYESAALEGWWDQGARSIRYDP